MGIATNFLRRCCKGVLWPFSVFVQIISVLNTKLYYDTLSVNTNYRRPRIPKYL
jgi:hypothetical protein